MYLPILLVVLGGAHIAKQGKGNKPRGAGTGAAYAQGVKDAVATVQALHRGAEQADIHALQDDGEAVFALTDQSPALKIVAARAFQRLADKAERLSKNGASPLFDKISGMGAIPADQVADEIVATTPVARWRDVRVALEANGVPKENILRVAKRWKTASPEARVELLAALNKGTARQLGAEGHTDAVQRLAGYIERRLTALEAVTAGKKTVVARQAMSQIATIREWTAEALTKRDLTRLRQLAAAVKKLNARFAPESKPQRRKRRSRVRGKGKGRGFKPLKRVRNTVRSMLGLVFGPAGPSGPTGIA